MSDTPKGYTIETAASLIARDWVGKFFGQFAQLIRRDRAAGKATHIEFVNGLAGVTSLLIAGGHGSREEIVEGTVSKLREYIDRDLQHLARQ